ncbi:mogroside IE synthase-like [Argentina anserina]|uniref:mogroside IE synthase-like n=1 Tax=Argentina anserina TaxID=57926 RepID=UPI00217665D7|nr:mogroside IE synthase-like [Potentilla anserina]
MEKEKEDGAYKAHCVVVPFPTQGHINPMLQFSKRLERKGLKVTLVTTKSFQNRSSSQSTSIALETISDGYDDGGMVVAESTEDYLDRFREIGSRTLTEVIHKLSDSGHRVDGIVYDAFMPWPLDVAKGFGIVGVPFFTQSCAVNNIYCHVHQGLLKVPPSTDETLLPGVRVPLRASDMPSFVSAPSQYPAFLRMVVDQFSNVDKADWIFCNTFYELEVEEADWMLKFWPLRTIGPTIPSMYLDKRHEDDKEYGFSLFKPNSDACMTWLNDRPKGSVAYVSFGSLAELGAEQMEELAWGLKNSNICFLWVVREKEATKLPSGFAEAIKEKGLVISWCPQLEVLANEAIGCFVTHCGWNSTLEALSSGVPMVAVPQWTDQSTNAKYIMDVWKMGLRAKADEEGIMRRQEIENCVREIMEGERGKEIKKNAWKWKELARKAVDEGGSSDRNIDEFIAKLVQHEHVAS